LQLTTHITPELPLGWVAGAAALGELKIPHGQHQSIIIPIAPHQKTKQGQTVAPFDRITVDLVSRNCLANLSWDILDTWPNQHSKDISIR